MVYFIFQNFFNKFTMSEGGDIRCKVVIIGEQLVGKTCIVNRFVNDSFSQTPQTVGAGYESKSLNVEGKNVRLQIWDTAGQEQYRSIATSYIRGSNAAIIVYGVDDKQTFESTQQWFETLISIADPGILIYLVANKIDIDREVTKQDGEAKAKACNAKYMEVSAKTGYNVLELFTEISVDYLEKMTRTHAPQTSVTFEKTSVDISSSKNQSQKKGGCC